MGQTSSYEKDESGFKGFFLEMKNTFINYDFSQSQQKDNKIKELKFQRYYAYFQEEDPSVRKFDYYSVD